MQTKTQTSIQKLGDTVSTLAARIEALTTALTTRLDPQAQPVVHAPFNSNIHSIFCHHNINNNINFRRSYRFTAGNSNIFNHTNMLMHDLTPYTAPKTRTSFIDAFMMMI
ncbi:hypothetical protein YC2023_098241 [Brassica napus]|uniref:Uncharacterized protein n=1 Tax=Brassica oleracea TaxID=3712 RepID=A0A3P6FM76_BRAOL|nr:unnamed protein product [Brassica oleracea]